METIDIYKNITSSNLEESIDWSKKPYFGGESMDYIFVRIKCEDNYLLGIPVSITGHEYWGRCETYHYKGYLCESADFDSNKPISIDGELYDVPSEDYGKFQSVVNSLGIEEMLSEEKMY